MRYLVQKKKREVTVYGVKDTFSRQLREAASRTVELPTDSLTSYYRLILRNIASVKHDESVIPTFNGTVDKVTRDGGVSRERTKTALVNMINKGYIFHRDFEVETKKKIKILDANWELLAKDGVLSEFFV